MFPIAPDVKPLFGALPVAGAIWTEEDFFAGLSAAPLSITVGPNFDSKTINLGGFDAYEGILNCSGTGTLTISILVIHPITAAVIATRQIAAAVATGPSLVTTWGAYSPNLPNDIFGIVKIRFVAATSTVTLTGLAIYGQVR